MKKLLLAIILGLTIFLLVITGFNGLNIGKLSVLGIKGIVSKNNELDLKLQEATKLSSTDFKNTRKNLDESISSLQDIKKEFEEKTNITTEEYLNGKSLLISPYKIDYLWITIGNHAKVEGVTMKMDTSKNGKEYPGNDVISDDKDKVYYYDISFTITGNYINIAEFIIDIEDDSSLGFKIEDFNMTSSDETGSVVQATFKCKDVAIKGISSLTDSSTSTNNSTDEDTSMIESTTQSVNKKQNTTGNTTGNTTTENQTVDE